jgi:hypothetical protein
MVKVPSRIIAPNPDPIRIGARKPSLAACEVQQGKGNRARQGSPTWA